MLLLTLLVGCSGKSDNKEAATAAVVRGFATATFRGPTTHETLDDGRLGFDHPTSWKLHTFAKYADLLSNRQLGINSNTRVRNPCRHDPDTNEVTCGAPLDEMQPASVYLQWSVIEPATAQPAESDSATVSGSNIEIDGRDATITARDSCGNIHGDREFSFLVSVAPQRTYWVLACVRGPGQKGLEANVLATLRSIHVTA